jgi:hypothetical protein
MDCSLSIVEERENRRERPTYQKQTGRVVSRANREDKRSKGGGRPPGFAVSTLGAR